MIAACILVVTSLCAVLIPIGIRRRAPNAIAATDDLRMVGPLVDRLRTGQKRRRTRRVVRQALIRLLPRLRAGDGYLLSREQHARLCATLVHLSMLGRDAELQIAIVAALQEVGGPAALPVVESLAHNRSRAANRRRVREAAQVCLPYLSRRAQMARYRGTLLRAADRTGVDSGELLRAALADPGVGPTLLLRAVDYYSPLADIELAAR